MKTIEIEAKKNSLLAIDEDKYRIKYKLQDSGYNIQFVSPQFYIFEKYRYYLLKESKRIQLPQKYYYRPDYLSYDEYGTTCLWYLLLYINDIPCIEEFNTNEILIPTFSSILKISKNTKKEIIDITDTSNNISNDLLNLYKTKIIPPESTTPTPITTPLTWIRQKFKLTQNNVINKYVDLIYEPVNNTINFKTELNRGHLYNVDYVLIENNQNQLKRISWDGDLCEEGNGLISLLSQDMLIEVTYGRIF